MATVAHHEHVMGPGSDQPVDDTQRSSFDIAFVTDFVIVLVKRKDGRPNEISPVILVRVWRGKNALWNANVVSSQQARRIAIIDAFELGDKTASVRARFDSP